jgi:glycosyltransferase involved in cell wall biosynthesis
MTAVRSLSVVMPVFNEESILQNTVDDVLTGLAGLPLESYELILVENGSTDTTRELAAALVDAYPFLRLMTMERADYGAALKAGLLAAVGDVIVNFDADYYDVDFIKRALVADGDVVVASKGLSDSKDHRSIVRRLASRIFGRLTRWLLRVHVRETHGMKLFRPAVLRLVPTIRATKDLFDTELLARAELAGLTIDELPITTNETRPSRSTILSRAPRTVLGLVEIRARLHAEPTGEVIPVPAASSLVVDAA